MGIGREILQALPAEFRPRLHPGRERKKNMREKDAAFLQAILGGKSNSLQVRDASSSSVFL